MVYHLVVVYYLDNMATDDLVKARSPSEFSLSFSGVGINILANTDENWYADSGTTKSKMHNYSAST